MGVFASYTAAAAWADEKLQDNDQECYRVVIFEARSRYIHQYVVQVVANPTSEARPQPAPARKTNKKAAAVDTLTPSRGRRLQLDDPSLDLTDEYDG
jgi:hypothetical protein